jgi:FixJ family two-component response regulator
MNRPTVFVVDDEFAVRDALKLFLESSGLAVKTFDSARSFLEGYRPQWPGCLVLDIRMPGMSGMALQQALKARQTPIPILFLTGHGDVPMAAKAFKSGAVDFIEKPFNDQELLDRIREALERDARARTHKVWKSTAQERYLHLTPRETEVMALVVAGRSNKEIARQLDVSHRTIDVHRARVMEKMGAQSLPELVNMAVACGVGP